MILLTGGSGFLGGAILEAGLESGMKFRTIGRTPIASCEHITADLEKELPASSFANVTTLIHSAGLAHQFGADADRRDRFFAVNTDMTEKLVGAAVANGVEHVILISSMSVYGLGGTKPKQETDQCLPIGHYAESKLEAELRARKVVAGTASRLTILRMTTLYGEGDQGNVSRLIRAIDQRRFLLVGDCENEKNLIYRADAARGCLSAIDHRSDEQISIYNVAVEPVSMKEVVTGICEHLKRKLPWRIPSIFVAGLSCISTVLGHKGPVGRTYDSIRKFLRTDVVDGSRFRDEFDFQPEVDLHEGLRRQVLHYQRSCTQE